MPAMNYFLNLQCNEIPLSVNLSLTLWEKYWFLMFPIAVKRIKICDVT